jgi:hypothetical protein
MYPFQKMLKLFNETNGECAKKWKKQTLVCFTRWLIEYKTRNNHESLLKALKEQIKYCQYCYGDGFRENVSGDKTTCERCKKAIEAIKNAEAL